MKLPLVLLTTALVGLHAAPTSAQSTCYKGDCQGLMIDAVGANYGAMTLGRGYELPPVQTSGVAGGTLDAASLGRTSDGPCRGFATALPDHVITVTDRTARFSIQVASTADTVLLVHGPDGWRCNDDTDGANPALGGTWSAGVYRLWVASYDGTYAPYTLRVANAGSATVPVRPTTPEPVVPTRPDVPQRPRTENVPNTRSVQPVYDAVTLDARALQSPVELQGRPGGPIALEPLGSTRTGPCLGFADRDPQHLVELPDGLRFGTFAVAADVDTTLAIHGPNGWLCNDDADGYNPAVTDRLAPGTYRVWVGTYGHGNVGTYRLRILDEQTGGPGAVPVVVPELEVRARFEGNDVVFQAADARGIYDRCQAHMATVGGMDWVDDVVLGGQSFRNTFGYWTPDQLCVMVASSVDDPEARWIARGTIEDTPFQFTGDTRDELQAQCRWFLSAFDDLWIDDIEVNGTQQRNAFGYWDSPEACMAIGARASER
jgi:hypothetical protein